MTTVDSDAKRADTARDGLLSRHLLFVFFLLSFILTWGYFWLIWTPLRLPDSLIALGGFGPAASAFLVLALTSGKSGVLRLLRSIVHWRVGATWYLVALLGLPVLNFLAFLVVPGVLGDFVAPGLRLPWIYLSEMAISVTVGIAPMWEEIGWRGFAQPRIQRQYGPVAGTLMLGVLWGVWHLPFFFGPLARTGPEATFVSASIALAEFSIGLTGLSVVMAWVLNNCRGSTLMAILLHACFDSSGLAMVALFPSTPPYYLPVHYQTLGIAIVFSVAALVLIVVTRGDLGYQRYQREVEAATSRTSR
ncbi:MAG TPA: type II CAAX endopeptidase family protein [Candidatus Udaeobacter sp.]|jgi:membrane protease YdiL (CAAX protease family)|nr:type II CAAX endopeptidase family protein [Candidatus Udaeobacter sp.]